MHMPEGVVRRCKHWAIVGTFSVHAQAKGLKDQDTDPPALPVPPATDGGTPAPAPPSTTPAVAPAATPASAAGPGGADVDMTSPGDTVTSPGGNGTSAKDNVASSSVKGTSAGGVDGPAVNDEGGKTPGTAGVTSDSQEGGVGETAAGGAEKMDIDGPGDEN
jgi:hypothetical protein